MGGLGLREQVEESESVSEKLLEGDGDRHWAFIRYQENHFEI